MIRKSRFNLIIVIVMFTAASLFAQTAPRTTRRSERQVSRGVAPTPPMGWNSYDAYCGDVTEQEFKANAAFMAKYLARYGWKYVVVDYYWYFPHPETEDFNQQEKLELAMDAYGRLLPAENRFPSAAGGKGFKPLADYVHSLGLKFGIHIMRGIPRAAVKQNLPILGTSAHARDIANLKNTCAWSTAMYGVDVSKPAGQAYYDSIVKLYAQWGVDYIKADDMTRGENPAGESYHAPEIEALHKAILKCGRPMVLSLSPGPTPPAEAQNVTQNANLWRISDDMWDNWKSVKRQFELARPWVPYIGGNHWPDADMLPVGRIRLRGFKDGPRHSRLTADELRTMISLWTIFRSPLMIGGDLPTLDAATLAYLTNAEAIAINQHSQHNRQLFVRGDQVAWAADSADGKTRYLAVFDLGDRGPLAVPVRWSELGLRGKYGVRDVWDSKDLGTFENGFSPQLPAHGGGLYAVTPRR
jgi:alpha-galactosidase